MTNWTREVAHAARSLWRRPITTTLSIASLALGIGATAVLFSVLDATVLRPLPFADLDRLVSVYVDVPTDGSTRGRLRPADGDWVELTRADLDLEGLAAIRSTGLPVRLDDRILTPLMREASLGYFEMLGVSPILGRLFSAEEVRPGAGDFAVLSHAFWRDELGQREDILGEALDFDGRPHTVLGVMPPGFLDPLYPTGPAAWLPLRIDENEMLARGGRRGNRSFLRVFGKLQDGDSVTRFEDRLGVLAAELGQRYEANQDRGLIAVPLLEDAVQNYRASVGFLFAAVTLVLLVACTNVGSLRLGIVTSRHDDFAVRRALGASTGRLVRLLMTENLLIAAVGGLLGVALAAGWMPIASAWVARVFFTPTFNAIDLDARAIGFAVTVSVLSAVIFGLAPVRQILRVRAGSAGRRSTASRGSLRQRRTLVILELALTTVLLVCAGLVLRSMLAVSAVPLGAVEEGGVILRSSARGAFAEREDFPRFERETVEALRRIPGVVAAGSTSVVPLFDAGRPVQIDLGEQALPGVEPTANQFVAGTGLFAAMGMPILEGRPFDERDALDSQPVTVVSREFVRRFMKPGEPAVGSVLRIAQSEPLSVVGVVGDLRRPGARPEPVPMMYVPAAQAPRETISYVVRGAPGAEAAILEAAGAAIQTVSPESPVYNSATMHDTVRNLGSPMAMLGQLLAAFAAISVFLACLGTFALLSQLVSDQRREIGIRMAFGASARDVMRRVLVSAAWMGGLGLVLGSVGAWVTAGLLRSQLYRVETLDPTTYLTVGATLLAVVWVAGSVPAWRASRVAPMEVLRRDQ